MQSIAAEKSKSDPTQYLLTLEQMIENDYPIPSYMAEVFQKPTGWVETPEQPPPANPSTRRPIYAIDCEMVRVHTFFTERTLTKLTVPHGRRQRAHASLPH